jgi:hypothetical protein
MPPFPLKSKHGHNSETIIPYQFVCFEVMPLFAEKKSISHVPAQ